MPITAGQLIENYWFACLYIAGTPYNFSRSDIDLADDGASTPNPYIKSWTVAGIPKPTDEYMMANVSLENIAYVNNEIEKAYVAYVMPKLRAVSISSQSILCGVNTKVCAVWNIIESSDKITFVNGVATVHEAGMYVVSHTNVFNYDPTANKIRSVGVKIDNNPIKENRVNSIAEEGEYTSVTIQEHIWLGLGSTISPYVYSVFTNPTQQVGSIDSESATFSIYKLY